MTYSLICFLPPFFWETQEDVEIVYLLKKVEEALDNLEDEVLDGDLSVIYVFGFNRSSSYFLAFWNYFVFNCFFTLLCRLKGFNNSFFGISFIRLLVRVFLFFSLLIILSLFIFFKVFYSSC